MPEQNNFQREVVRVFNGCLLKVIYFEEIVNF